MSLHARLQAVRDDHALLVRSVAIRSAFAFGDWPPLLFSSRELSTVASGVPTPPASLLDGSLDVRERVWDQPVG